MVRLRLEDVERLQRSLGAAGQLPAEQVRVVLVELEHLMRERREVEVLLGQLQERWTDLRAVLNALHRLGS